MQAVCMNLIPSLYMTYYRHGMYWLVLMIFMELLVMYISGPDKVIFVDVLWCRLLEKRVKCFRDKQHSFFTVGIDKFSLRY